MSKKLILFLMLAIFGSTSLLKAEEVTIGDPTGTTTSSYLPTYSFYKYSWTQQIYTAEEIGMAGTINSFTMWLKNTTSYARNVTIYMKNVDKDAFTSTTDWVPMLPTDIVCTATISNQLSTNQEVTFTLDVPFEYDGESNLLICFHDMTGSYSSGVNCIVFEPTSAPNRSIYAYRDGSAYDPSAPGVTGYTTKQRDVVRLDMTPMAGGITLTPANLDLGARPNNGWMEPAYIKVKNTDPSVATVSTSFVTYASAFDVEHLNNYQLGYKQSVDVEIKPAAGYVGSVEAAFTANYTLGAKESTSAIVTGEFYTAPANDVVETATPITFTDGYAELYPDMANMHQNYNLPFGNAKDAVYTFTIDHAMKFSVGASDGTTVTLYNFGGEEAHPMADNYLAAANGSLAQMSINAGTYYLVLAGDEAAAGAQLVEFPPLTQAPVLASPDDQSLEVAVPVTLTWNTLPEGTVEYRVLLNTVYALPVSTSVIVDWTSDLATSVVVEDLFPGTQYFWQVQARGSNGNVLSSDKWGFTTKINTPKNLEILDGTIFEGDLAELKWKSGEAGGFEGELTVCDGTATNGNVPVHGLWADAYLKCQMVYSAEMLEEMEGGEITSLKYYISSPSSVANWGSASFQVYMMEVPSTTIAAFIDPSIATTVYTGSLNGTGTEMVITLDTPFEYEGGNLLVGIDNTVCGSYSSCYFYGIEATGACVQGYSYTSLASITPSPQSFLPKTTFVCGGAKADRTFEGYNVYVDNVKVNDELITDKRYNIEGLTYNMNGYSIGVTAVHTVGESAQCENVMAYVSGEGSVYGHVTDLDGIEPLEGITIALEGTDEFGDAVEYSTTTDANGDYTIDVKVGTYDVTAQHPEFQSVTVEDVIVVYATGTEVNFVIHESYNPVSGVLAEEIDETMSKASWSFGNMPGPGGAGDEFEYGFENDLEGWTNIDNDGDGHMWYHSTGAGDHSTLAITSHTGAGHVMGESYCNATWAALTPDDYLVTPQMYNIGGSSVLTFWACAQDASYAAEHFGVAISTASNTSAADFTTVAEWTLTAKGGTTVEAFAKKEVRGMSTREGNWYQFTADLSAFGGQQAWIAIRHFNCSDQFIICVDDVQMMNAERGDRSLQYYTVYRQQTLNENGPVEEPEQIVLNPTCYDTAYVDFAWGNMETGVYQYGVQVTYAGNHNPSRELTTLINEGFEGGSMPAGWTSEGSNTWIIGTGDYYTSTGAASGSYNALCTHYSYLDAYLVTPAMDLSKATSGTVSFSVVNRSWAGDTDGFGVYYRVAGGDWNEIYFSSSTNSSWTQYTFDLTGFAADYQLGFLYYDNWGYGVGIDDVTVVAEIEEEPEPQPITEIVWSNYLPKNMDMTLNLAVTTNSNDDVRGAVAVFTNVSEPDLTFVYEAELDSTGLYTFEEFRKGIYDVTVELAGFATFEAEGVEFWADADYAVVLTELFNTVENLSVSSTGYAQWSAPTRSVEGYLVMLNGISQGQTEDTYMILDVDGLEEGQACEVKVAATYTTGVSDWVTANFTYSSCENFPSDIEEVTADAKCMDVMFTWGGTPVPPVPPTPGEGDEFTEGFEGGLNGWNVLTVLSDGGSWIHSNNNLGGYDYTALAHGGSGFAMCYSFVDYVGSYNTDSYMYTPQKYNITTGSTLTFWADNANDSYPENFSVCVATADNPQASDFTQVWSGGAKGSNSAKVANRHNSTRYENWRQHTIDLSSYAGQAVYIAFHDVNYDMYEIWIDDVELSVGGKNARAMWDRVASFSLNGAGEQGIATDGQFIYTSSWSGYPGYDFGKYTLDGSFIEGFSISGATGVRDLTYDGQYFYGSSGSSAIYILDLANKTKVGQITTGATTRHCTYDPVRDAFWVGNWSDLYLYDRNGSLVQSGPAPSSAYGSGYFKTEDGNEHLYLFCQPNSDAKVYDYNITTGVLSSSPVFDFSQTPGFASDGMAGGSFVGNYNGKACWFGNAQQDPNLVGIYELGAAVGPTPGPGGSGIQANSWALFLDGEFIECVDLETLAYEMTMTDTEEHNFMVVKVDANYNMSCGDGVDFVAGYVSAPTNLTATETEEGIALTWAGIGDSFKVYRGTSAYDLIEIAEVADATYLDDFNGSCVYGVRAVAECGESDVTIVAYVGIDEEIVAETRIYPNPTKDEIRIEALGMRQITIVNALGQTVYNQNVNADEMRIDMSQFGAGMYIVNIITENGTIAQRISVIK